jgi:hypothetical protein
MTSAEESRDYRHVECLIDMLQSSVSSDLKSASESLAMTCGVLGEQSESPSVIQYARGVGGFAVNMSEHNVRTAILFDSQEAIDFAKELSEDRNSQHLSIVDGPLPVEKLAFPISPDGKGWSYVILDDIVPYVGGDLQLTTLLKAIYLATAEDAKLVIRLPNIESKSWNKEYNKTVVTESISKVSIRKFQKTITSHGEIQLRHADDIYNFSAGDIHDCARNSNFRPTRDLGLDPSVWCCYDRV